MPEFNAHMPGCYFAIVDTGQCYFGVTDTLCFFPDGVDRQVAPVASFQLFPNPAVNELIISSADKITSVAIFSILGQEVFNREYNTGEVKVDVSNLKSGIYIVRINDIEVRRFLKE